MGISGNSKFYHDTHMVMTLWGMLAGVGRALDKGLTWAACKVRRTFTTVAHTRATISTGHSSTKVKQRSTFTMRTYQTSCTANELPGHAQTRDTDSTVHTL